MSTRDEQTSALGEEDERHLAKIGVPRSVFGDLVAWSHFLAHGEVSADIDFSILDLDRDAQNWLYGFLVRHAPLSRACERARALLFDRLTDVHDPSELVRAAISDHGVLKEAVRRLGTLPPDERAAQLVIGLHDRGELESWVAAALLGGVRHRAGYAKVMEILAANDAAANPWAGTALVRIVGLEAEPALARVIDEVEHGFARKAAALALARLGTESSIAFLIDALGRGRLRARSVAEALEQTRVEPELLVRALGSSTVEVRRWPPMLIAERIRSGRRGGATAAELVRCAASAELRAALAALVLDDTEEVVWSADRKLIEAWLAAVVA